MKCTQQQPNQGFTLIELLLYLAIATILVVVISTISIAVLRSAKKTSLMQDVAYTGLYVLETLDQAAARAYSIETPESSATSSLLVLRTYDAALDPIAVTQTGQTLILSQAETNLGRIQPNTVETTIVFTRTATNTAAVVVSVSASSTSAVASVQASEVFESTITVMSP